MAEPAAAPPSPEIPAHRYDAALAQQIEATWQDRWEKESTFASPNPAGPLADGFAAVAAREKLYVLDMFPYPSGVGLHVGHPLGYIGTDVFARFHRMDGRNVLHTMGYDAFGLPAEQHAVQTNTHPQVTTTANIATMRAQLRRLGMGHDARRSIVTTDPGYYRWTQWIFLQLFGSWYDPEADRARPIGELEAAFDDGRRVPAPESNPAGRPWAELDETGRRTVLNARRLAYLQKAEVNWCPGLGTVLANEEVTADGRSERGNLPVFRRPLEQWVLRITAYADRLIDDLDTLEWPEAIKTMQRNWIGRSTGAHVSFATGVSDPIEVFTTRPDTLFGATYLVLAPEHPLVGALTAEAWPADVPAPWTGGAASPAEAVRTYRTDATRRSDSERASGDRTKTGVFTGCTATNPATGAPIQVFVADYVLMGYGTGAIMAVPGQDQRDWDFARQFGLPIVRTVQPPVGFDGEAFLGEGPAINSGFLDGLDVAHAKATIIQWLEAEGHGRGTVQYKLRDWLFSRQRYWGEPFPIVYGDDGQPRAVPEDQLPVALPPMDDFSPRTFTDEDSDPEPPLGRVPGWATVTLDLGDGPRDYRRELDTMPNWAGSCWYELRYLDPTNDEVFCDPDIEAYWMGPRDAEDCGGVDLYVGGVEHAVLHLLYARFWHKVLHDLGHVSSFEPYRRLFNQGTVQAFEYLDARGIHVPAEKVSELDGRFLYEGAEVTRQLGRMGKSRKNAVAPDEMCERYGADTLRLYEMFAGPLDTSRPWDTTAVVGMYRLLQRIWRNLVDEDTGVVTVSESPADPTTRRLLHQTIASAREGMASLRFNTAIARITELNNHLTGLDAVPREIAEPLVLILAPLAPHIAEELWHRLGHDESLAWAPYPQADESLLVTATVEIPVQVNGKVRARVTVPTDATSDDVEAVARADEKVAALLEAGTVRKVIVVPSRMISFVVA